MTATLPPAKWLVELVLISNEARRKKYLDRARIHRFLALAIQDECHMTSALIKFFPRTDNTSPGTLPLTGRHPTRPVPRRPALIGITWPTALTTPPKGHYSGASSGYVPNFGHICSHRLPRIPPRIVELCGGLATGLDALLRVGYAISSYAWVDTNPDARTAASHRITYLRYQFPYLLPPEATHG